MNVHWNEIVVTLPPLTKLGVERYNTFWLAKYAPHNGNPGWMPVSEGYVVRSKVKTINHIFGERIDLMVKREY